jgi:hypothetical protein
MADATFVDLSSTPMFLYAHFRDFLKGHERLILFVLGFALLWFVSGKIENIIARHDNANLTAVTATLEAQKEANKKTTDLVAQQAVDMRALNARMTAQDAALAQANKALVAALEQRQQANNNLTVPELLVRWEQLVPGAGVSVINGQTVIADAGAHATVNELEKVPVLTTQLANETKVVENTNTLLAAANGQVSTLNTLVAGKNAELKDADNKCNAQIKVVKDAATKSKRRWAVVAGIGGFIFRQVIKSYTGL